MSSELFNFDLLDFETSTQSSENESVFSQNNSTLQLAFSVSLNKLLEENKKQKIYASKCKEQAKNVFTASSAPKITMLEYLNRIVRYTEIEDPTLILAIIYFDKICQKIYLTEYNIHNLILTSVLVAMKMDEDLIYNNKYYAEVVGVSLKKLNTLEREFFAICNYNLYIKPEVYEKYNFYMTHFLDKC